MAIRLWGPEVGQRYVERITSIDVMPSFEDAKALRAWHTHELTGNRKGEWAITIIGKWRLIVVPSDDGLSLQVKEVSNHYGD